jgi:hypothetical protein
MQSCLGRVRDFVATELAALHAEVAARVHEDPGAPPWSPHHLANVAHDTCGLPGRALDMVWPPKLAVSFVPCLPVKVGRGGGYQGRAIGVRGAPIGAPLEQWELVVENCEAGERPSAGACHLMPSVFGARNLSGLRCPPPPPPSPTAHQVMTSPLYPSVP